ncbi:unnamed protein product [Clonostachys chloroleuca]|uniref:Mitochondrial acidic protein MAM33 n=1 Tax=Clonostachys chloroleuca TaxID=1926264 RepID=A0AA35MA69_9HYPO|nr:unnamed protein product [Clonostachys chloroleuca]
MMSARSIARSAPRVVSRIAGSSIRQFTVTHPTTLLKPTVAAALRAAHASPFSTTTGLRASRSETDEELSVKLDSEIQIEEDMKANEQQPASVKDFLANTAFELIDTPGQEVVKLVRTFGEEKITVSFSIADITNYDPYNEDPALEDEEDFNEDVIQSSGKQASDSSRAAPEEDLEGEEEDDIEDAAAPINLSIVIEKPGKTSAALNIDATAQDGAIVVDNLFYYEDAKVARVDKPEDAQARADVYPGPPFGSLDEDLQVLMERFLEERGITQTLAVFVPDYVDVKEQREYLRWLNNVKNFVDA